jgi:hypothetical protein
MGGGFSSILIISARFFRRAISSAVSPCLFFASLNYATQIFSDSSSLFDIIIDIIASGIQKKK